MAIGEISSDEARRRWREVLDAVEHDAEHVTVLRYNRPGPVLVPTDWYWPRRPAEDDRIRRFSLDMAMIKCPDCEAEFYPTYLGEAIDWATGHECEKEES